MKVTTSEPFTAHTEGNTTINETLIEGLEMNKENAHTEFYSPDLGHEKMKIKQLLGEQVYESLKFCGAILAGGAITSILSGSEVNDFDIYWKSKESFGNFLIGVYGCNDSLDLDISSLRINHHTSRSILLQTPDVSEGSPTYVQLIGMRPFPSVQDIFDSFDFTINMAAFDFAAETFYLHKDCLKDIAQRRLVVNEKTAYPFVSVLRVDKYQERGYSISKAQMMKLLLAVNAKNMDSWEKLKEELGGLYGLNPDEVVDDTKEFSLQEAMDQLSKLFIPKRYENISSLPKSSDIAKAFEHMLTPEAFKFLSDDLSWMKKWIPEFITF